MSSLAKPNDVSPLAELETQVAEFRSTHPPGTRLPPALWQSVAELARHHGTSRVARLLKLNYGTLKKYAGVASELGGTRKKAHPQFLELIGAPCHREDEYLIEFESARGKLRIHCKTNTPPDWVALLRAWRGA